MSFGNGELLSVGSWDQTVKVYKLPDKFYFRFSVFKTKDRNLQKYPTNKVLYITE